MTNRIAIPMGLVIVGAIMVDLVLYDAQNLIFLGKKLFDLMEWIAFWR
ncbi:MAG: hypothetical protein L3J36_00165 [Rhodobacteraceae bacterium]|nr:hypothetical protein [Paracoccaceae bacterium]